VVNKTRRSEVCSRPRVEVGLTVIGITKTAAMQAHRWSDPLQVLEEMLQNSKGSSEAPPHCSHWHIAREVRCKSCRGPRRSGCVRPARFPFQRNSCYSPIIRGNRVFLEVQPTRILQSVVNPAAQLRSSTLSICHIWNRAYHSAYLGQKKPG